MLQSFITVGFFPIIQIGTKGKTEVIDDELNPVWKEVSNNVMSSKQCSVVY